MSTIYVRITLLTLATVMFGMIWSHDHEPVIKQKTVVAYDFDWPCAVKTVDPVIQMVSWQQLDESVLPLSFESEILIDNLVKQSAASVSVVAPEFIVVSRLTYPLPHDLAVGDYRVIDQSGNVQSLSVTAENLRDWGLSASNSPQNSYEIHSRDCRWHFIKISEPVAIVSEEDKPSDIEMEAAWGSVLSFAGEAINPAVQQVSKPFQNWLSNDVRLSAKPAQLN
jgi:hypothetical protein